MVNLHMNKGLSDYELYKVIRPTYGDFTLDQENMPVMHKVEAGSIDFNNANPTNLSNFTNKKDNSNRIVFPFNSDKVLEKYWNDPLKYIPLLQTCMLIGTPDYSLLPSMNPNLIRANVYRNRWIGCTWQNYGINAVPVIGWVKPDTYDVCFSGVEHGGVVMISTISCQTHKQEFLQGYNEMIKRISPSLIIVYGNMISGMTGTFINYTMKDCFNDSVKSKNIKQESLFEISPIFTVKEVYDYGL